VVIFNTAVILLSDLLFPKDIYITSGVLNRLSLPPIVYTLYTALPFEALAIEWLKEASQKAVGEQLGLSLG